MPIKILVKRSSTPSDAPSVNDLTPGELALNVADGKLYTKKSDGSIVELSSGEGGAGATELGGLNNVTLSSPADNELLAYDDGSSDWINQTAAEAGLATASALTSHTNDTDNPHDVSAAQVGAITAVVDDTTPQLGGDLDAQDNDINDIQVATYNDVHANGNSGTSATINWNNGNKQKITLTGNVTLSFTDAGDGSFQLVLVQDDSGDRTITWPANVKWPGGTAPTLSTAASSIDIVSFLYDQTADVYYGVASLDFQ